MREGDVILASVPQADGETKNRPAVLLREMPGYGDLLVCGVSRQLQECVRGFDEVIRSTDADFGSSGLVSSSLIRLAFLAVLPRRRAMGSIGKISPQRHERLLRALSDYLIGELPPTGRGA